LFLFTDEQRFDTLACYGNNRLEMPNLNRFAERAYAFDETYCTQPVCTPSRGSILTGLYPFAHGADSNNVPLHPQSRCLPELLPAQLRRQYVTAYHGKWHLGDEIFPQHGFDEWRSIEDLEYRRFYSAGRDRNQLSTYAQWLRQQGYKPSKDGFFTRELVTNLPERAGKPAYLATEASRFIREHRDEPFILYVNMLEPHMPFFGPRDGQYDPAATPLPSNFDAPPGKDTHLKSQLLAARFQAEGFERYDLSTEAGWRQMNAAYWGLCSLIDTHMGRILQALDESGQADNTIVVFTSDHGEMMGSHRLLGKTVMYQESVRVPCLIRIPGQQQQHRVRGPFSQIDLVPTLLELMGASNETELHGISRAGQLGGRDATLQEDAFIIWHGREGHVGSWAASVTDSPETAAQAMAEDVRTIITADGWRYSHSPALGPHELFDLNNDPQERVNLATRPELQLLTHELRDRIRAWQKRTGDVAPI
jgi:arylsulfatase A-like enzyme